MSVQLETRDAVNARAEAAMQWAQKIIKDSCLDTGMTEAEYDNGLLAAEVFDGLLARGYSEDAANDAMDEMSHDEIGRKHQELFPRRYETK